MKSWKTTLGGILIAIGQAISEEPNQNLKIASKILTVVGALLLGASAKDSNVTNVGKNAVTLKEIKEADALEDTATLN